MPGSKDFFSYRADYMTQFFLFRSNITSSETDPTFTSGRIDLSDSVSASDHNKIYCMVEETAAASNAEVTLRVYFLPAPDKVTNSLRSAWIESNVLQNVKKNTLIKFENLYAGWYVILVDDHPGAGENYSLHVSHSNLNSSTEFQHS